MKVLLILCLTLTGCATYTSSSDPFVMAGQSSTLIQAFAGSNQVSAGLIEGQNYYRNIDATIQNPWNRFFALRNLWLP